jgi:hypothetical protein
MEDIPDRSTIGGGASATPSPLAQLDARISRGDLRRRQDADDPEGERNQEDEPDMRIPEGIRIPTPPDMVSSGSRRWSLKSSLSFKGSKGIEKSRGASNPAGASRLQSSAAGKGNRHNTLTANTPRKAISHGSSTTRYVPTWRLLLSHKSTAALTQRAHTRTLTHPPVTRVSPPAAQTACAMRQEHACAWHALHTGASFV